MKARVMLAIWFKLSTQWLVSIGNVTVFVVVVVYTVTLSIKASLLDSLNHFTILNQPPYSFVACLASSIGCSLHLLGRPTVRD